MKKPNPRARGPETGGSWAILGGVFDPIHNGHLTLAGDMYATGRFDGILFVPSYDPPHKNHRQPVSFAHRVAMLDLAVSNLQYFHVSEIEAEMGMPGYTLNTVRALKKRYPGAEFSFILGADNIGDFKNWYEPAGILDEVRVVAGARPGYQREDGFPADRIEFVETGLVDVSSTLVRELLRSGAGLEQLRQLVPQPVAEYILERKLYT